MPLHGFHNLDLLDNFDPTIATGGTTSDIVLNGVAWRVHTFTSVGSTTLNVTSPGDLKYLEYLVVGGGGGGGSGGANVAGGGGGAGGFLTGTFSPSTAAYTVTVGAAGAANSGRGGNSVFNTVTALGGGPADGVGGETNSDGASGGGATGNLTRGLGTAGQGNNGGTGQGSYGVSVCSGGGGGGAGGAGQNSPANSSFASGGAGVSNSITGTPVTYCVGGQGGPYTTYTAVAVGSNNGYGGQGSGGQANGSGTAGGSGIVVVRYPLRPLS